MADSLIPSRRLISNSQKVQSIHSIESPKAAAFSIDRLLAPCRRPAASSTSPQDKPRQDVFYTENILRPECKFSFNLFPVQKLPIYYQCDFILIIKCTENIYLYINFVLYTMYDFEVIY